MIDEKYGCEQTHLSDVVNCGLPRWMWNDYIFDKFEDVSGHDREKIKSLFDSINKQPLPEGPSLTKPGVYHRNGEPYCACPMCNSMINMHYKYCPECGYKTNW